MKTLPDASASATPDDAPGSASRRIDDFDVTSAAFTLFSGGLDAEHYIVCSLDNISRVSVASVSFG